MSEELKPCPFCGSTAELKDYGRGRICVQCSDADCRAHSMLSLPGEDAIKAWNTRPSNERTRAFEEAAEIADVGAQSARAFITQCAKWSPLQGEWSRARDLATDIADAIRALPTPPISDEDVEKARTALKQWHCPSCGGSTTYVNRWKDADGHHENTVPCKVCESTGLHPIASAALAAMGDR